MQTLKIHSAASMHSGSGRKSSEIPMSAGLKKANEVAITTSNYGQYKKLSDYIELCAIM